MSMEKAIAASGWTAWCQSARDLPRDTRAPAQPQPVKTNEDGQHAK